MLNRLITAAEHQGGEEQVRWKERTSLEMGLFKDLHQPPPHTPGEPAALWESSRVHLGPSESYMDLIVLVMWRLRVMCNLNLLICNLIQCWQSIRSISLLNFY